MNLSTPAKARILAVDDDPANLDVLANLLHAHYDMLAATAGERALQLAADAPPPDLILLDVLMPGMDGYTVLARLCENPATRDIPVIFVTGLDSVEEEEKGLALGAVDYIAKPYQSAIMLARIHTHLELKRARDWLANQNDYLEAEVARRVAENLSIQEASRQALAQLNHQKELILASAGEGIYGTDAQGVITFANPTALSILGYEADDLLGQDAHAAIHHSKANGSPYPQEDCPMRQSLVGGVVIRGKEETYWRKDGSPLPVLFTSMPIREEGAIVGSVVTFQDISERLRYQAQLERQSNFDELTGLPNRNLLSDRLAQAVTRCRQSGNNLALLVINLDRFKEINDSLGNDVGDQLLREVSVRLGSVGEAANTVAHTGADEFVLLAEGGEAGETVSLAQDILKSLAEPFVIEAQELFLSVGIGIAVFPKDGKDGRTLLRNASAAMYRAKAVGGTNFHFYAAEMNAHSLQQLKLENELRRAVERNELILHYQPQMSLRNGELIGMEALVRWRHPVRGLVSPVEFIPLAEKSGLIIPIGEWVLRTACTQNQAWVAAGLSSMAVAVNLSARQFEAQNIVALTAQVLRETGLDPGFLELELTESAAMSNADAFVGMTKELKDLSISLSIDDFGTGYSSLSYLKRFSLDRLKIDQSFVRDIVQDPDSAAIVAAIIELSHSLGLSVIAEGVETEDQLAFLRRRGCDEMQGFYFSKPLPAGEFELLLRERRKLALPTADALPSLLLVDDEAPILSALKRLLRREGYPILTATSAQEGLGLLARHEVAVIMFDQRMPNMSGSEFLAQVREMYPHAIRIILSGYTDLQAVTEVVNRGEIYKFLHKPWDDAELLETLREAFRLYETRRTSRASAT